MKLLKITFENYQCFLLTVIVALLISGCQNGLTNKLDAESNIINEISIPANSKLIMIPVTLKGKEYNFVLDTGASRTAFDVSLKDQLGWRLQSSKAIAADGKKIDIEYYWLTHAHFGGLCKKHKKVAVMDMSNVSEIAERKVDGIVGMDILKDHIVQFDFKNGKVSFLRSRTEFLGAEVKLYLKKNKVYMTAELENNPVRFLVDTGFKDSYFGGLLESEVISKLSSVIGDAASSQARTIAGKMDFDGRKVAVVDLSIGELDYEKVTFVEHRESIIGLGFLSRHVVTFDFSGKKMYLEKIDGAGNSSEFSLTLPGLNFKLTNSDNKFIVESIDLDGIGFEKGIREGDVVLKINDNDISSYSLGEFVNLLQTLAKDPDLKRFDLSVLRDSKTHEISLLR